MSESTTYCVINGRVADAQEPCLLGSDRGLLLGHGVFTTLRLRCGQPEYFAAHWQRLTTSCRALGIPFSLAPATCLNYLQLGLEANQLQQHSSLGARITVTAGSGPRGLSTVVAAEATVLIHIFPCPPQPQHPLRLISVEDHCYERLPITTIKTINYLPNLLARRKAEQAGADAALLINSQGRVAEACSSNFFGVLLDGQIITPPLTEGALPGIMRGAILQQAQHEALPLAERPITKRHLIEFNEAFLTNALMGIQAVASIDDIVLPDIPASRSVTHQLNQALRSDPQLPAVIGQELLQT